MSAVLIQNSWNEEGVKFWSLRFFTMFSAVAGPSSCKPPPWGIPSTMWDTASLNSRRRIPWASNLTGSTLKSSKANWATSDCGTLRMKQPWPMPLGSGTIARSPRITCPAGRAFGSTHTTSPFFLPPDSSTATHTKFTAAGITAGGTTAAPAPKTPGGGGGGTGTIGTTGGAGGAGAAPANGRPKANRCAFASRRPCVMWWASDAGSNGANPYIWWAGIRAGGLPPAPKYSKSTKSGLRPSICSGYLSRSGVRICQTFPSTLPNNSLVCQTGGIPP